MANFNLRNQQVDTQYIAGRDIAIYHQVVPLTLTAAQQKRNRTAMLERVHSYWIKGVLDHSLSGTSLALGLREQCDIVAASRHMDLDDASPQFHDLPPGTPLLQVFTNVDDELLILGEPGSGKTTLLLELARDLLDRATHDETYPIPVVFNLSSWALKQQSLSLWLVEELERKYIVPRKLAVSWVANDQLLPIFDGLDEVATVHRESCVEAINTYHRAHGLVPLVVSCRSADYDTLQMHLQVHHTVVVQPLTILQIDDYLTRVGEPTNALRLILSKDPALQELATTPLLLNILMQAYQDKRVEDLISTDTPAAQRQRILANYVQRMLQEKGKQIHYQQSQVVHWLGWLAQQLTLRSQTEFSIEHIQPDWLVEQRERRVYERLGVRLPGVLFGIAVSPVVWMASSNINKIGTANSLYYILLMMFIGGLIGGLFSENSTGQHFERSLTPALVAGMFITVVAALLYKLNNASSSWNQAVVGAGMLGLGSFLLSILVLNGFVGRVNTDIHQESVTTGSLKSLLSPLLKAGHLRNGGIVGLIYGLAFWLDGLLSPQQSFLFIGGPVYGLMLGTSGIILSTILGGREKTVQPVEALVWSWSDFRRGLANLKHLRNGVLIGITCGFICGLGTGLRMGPSVILKEGMIYGVSDGVAVGLGYWLFVALLQGVSGAILDEHLHIMPNQGIRLSGHNGLFMGLIGACVSGVFAFVAVLLRNMLGDQQHAIHNRYVIEALGATLLVGLAGGLIVSLLNGWLAYIRHVVLRILLLRTGAIPSHYPDFLDEAAACILLRKIGGNYIFIHRLVLDHFAKATTQDLWGQQQVAASQQLAWGGMQASASAPVQQGQQAPAAFGVSSPPAFAGWGQSQQADPWANQAASPVTQPNGLQAAGSSGPSWQQGNPGTQGGVGFAGNGPNKTMLCPGLALQQSGIVGYVQVKEGKEPGRIYEIRKESLSIGRSRESDIFLENLAVSRLHASIVNMGNGTYALKDEGSANGTKVNDQLVDKFKTYPLQEGDQIQLGQTILVFARH